MRVEKLMVTKAIANRQVTVKSPSFCKSLPTVPMIRAFAALVITGIPLLALTQVQTAGPHANVAHMEGRTWNISTSNENFTHPWPARRIGRQPRPYLNFHAGIVEGSPGCGEFHGAYRRSGNQLSLSIKWTDSSNKPCDGMIVRDVSVMLNAFKNVQRVEPEPEYWHEDALLLNSKKQTEVVLSPKETGSDLSEFSDTFWHITKLNGGSSGLSEIIIQIREGDIEFSTQSILRSFPFEYRLAGLEFFPSWHSADNEKDFRHLNDAQNALAVEHALHEITSYTQHENSLTFLNTAGQSIITLEKIRPEGIEEQRWRIARYRAEGTHPSNEDQLAVVKDSAEIILFNSQVEGSPGCMAWQGAYQLKTDRLTVLAGEVGSGVCSKEEEALSGHVQAAFKGPLKIEKKGENMLLRDDSGDVRIVLVPFN